MANKGFSSKKAKVAIVDADLSAESLRNILVEAESALAVWRAAHLPSYILDLFRLVDTLQDYLAIHSQAGERAARGTYSKQELAKLLRTAHGASAKLEEMESGRALLQKPGYWKSSDERATQLMRKALRALMLYHTRDITQDAGYDVFIANMRDMVVSGAYLIDGNDLAAIARLMRSLALSPIPSNFWDAYNKDSRPEADDDDV